MLKYISKILSLVLTLTLLVSANITTVNASTAVTLTASNVSCEAGNEVEVPIILSGNTNGVMGLTFSFSYDSKLTLVSASRGSDLPISFGFTPQNDYLTANPCKIVIDGIDADGFNGTVVILKFKAPENETGSFEINLSYAVGDIYDGNLDDIDVTIVNGSININSSESTPTEPTLITANELRNGNTVTLDAILSSPDSLSGTVIAASYDEDNLMIDVQTYNASSEIDISLDYTNGNYVKIMWWDMDTLTPYTVSVQPKF